MGILLCSGIASESAAAGGAAVAGLAREGRQAKVPSRVCWREWWLLLQQRVPLLFCSQHHGDEIDVLRSGSNGPRGRQWCCVVWGPPAGEA